MTPEVLALVVCPACHGVLVGRTPDAIVCRRCGRVYPVRDGIPVLVDVGNEGAPHGTGV